MCIRDRIRDNKILEVTNCDLALIGAKLIDAKGMYIAVSYTHLDVYKRQTEHYREKRTGNEAL